MNTQTLREVSNIPSMADIKRLATRTGIGSHHLSSSAATHVDPARSSSGALQSSAGLSVTGMAPSSRATYQLRPPSSIAGSGFMGTLSGNSVNVLSSGSTSSHCFDSTWNAPTAGASTSPMKSDVAGSSASLAAHVSRVSTKVDQYYEGKAMYCPDLAPDIAAMYLECDRNHVRDAAYLQQQPEINEKMRMILVDWLVDVHLKFKLHPATFYLAVDLIDRFLAVAKVTRSNLQLVGITCVLIAAKYEEIWPPEVKECIHISANTYKHDEILRMERTICTALSFRLSLPTSYPYLERLLTVLLADSQLRHAAFFYLEHAALDYKCLRFSPAQLANASMFLANLTLCKDELWGQTLVHYTKGADVLSFREAAAVILDCVNYVPTTKYQAIRRKYNSSRFGEISKLLLPNELPRDA